MKNNKMSKSMTENESIEQLKAFFQNNSTIDEREALKKAIRILEEIQQYRAIGTVEELESLINTSEWWEHMNNLAYIQGRSDAIDEFAEKLHNLCGYETDDYQYPYLLHKSRIDEIAENMKAGDKNE